MRFVDTQLGTFEVLDDIHGNAVAVSLDDCEFVIKFGKPSAYVEDEEVVSAVEGC